MNTLTPTTLRLLLCCCALLAILHPAQAQPVTNVYEILSGQYVACCGFGGELGYSLPDDSQSHIWLTTDVARQSAELVILGYLDAEPVFQIIRNGRLHPGYIEFGSPISPGPGLAREHYIVSNSNSGLRLDGLRVTPMIGADIPNRFSHSNVVARLLPATPITTSIRVSEVEICWERISNRTYQVQFRNSVTNQWSILQELVFGNGGIKCITDRVGADQPRRFYRVLPSP